MNMTKPFLQPSRPFRWLLLWIPTVPAVAVPACTRYVEVDRGPQAYYQTGYPLRDTSEDLERILQSVKAINVTGVYRTYVFSEDDAPTASVPHATLLTRAVDTASVHRSRQASAVVVSEADRRLLLLTANHAVHFPDTVIEYLDDEDGQTPTEAPSRRIRSISVLTHRSNWVRGPPSMVPFEVLAQDAESDLAFLGVETPEDLDPGEMRAFPGSAGNPDSLSWGSFVYVVGHPAGFPMVTRGIVSDPGAELTDSFLLDGLWNEGMSGGLVLAVRGAGGELEWIGMARASAATMELRLMPEEGALAEHDPARAYEGPLYLEEVRRIQYGVTMAVPMDRIRRFVRRHEAGLRARGYGVPIP